MRIATKGKPQVKYGTSLGGRKKYKRIAKRCSLGGCSPWFIQADLGFELGGVLGDALSKC